MTTVDITHIGGPTTLIEIGGWRLLTDPTFDSGWTVSSFVDRQLGSPDVFVGHFRPGSSSSSPPRVSMAMAMRASGEW